MTTFMTDDELDKFEADRDIGAEILQGIKEMLNNNAAKRTTVTETDISLASKNRSNEQERSLIYS